MIIVYNREKILPVKIPQLSTDIYQGV